MSDSRAHSPIVIDRVERSRGGGDSVMVRLAGHRLAAATEAELDPLLVIDLHGRRHRFAARRDGQGDRAPGRWEACFAVPDWAVPVEYGQASIWVGSASVPVPPVGTKRRADEPVPGTEPSAPASGFESEAPGPAPGLESAPSATAVAARGVQAGRAGPLADVLIRDTVAALHAELSQHAERETALGVALERARSELAARSSSQAELEATHAELRAELGRLTDAVAEQQAEFDRRLGEARQRSEAELAQARERYEAELAQAHERSEAELAQTRERYEAELAQARADVAAARDRQAELAETREWLAAMNERLTAALESERLRAQEASSLREQLAAAQISRDAAIAEAGGLRSELARLGSEVAIARERSSGGDDLGDAQQLLEEARALTAQLRGPSVG